MEHVINTSLESVFINLRIKWIRLSEVSMPITEYSYIQLPVFVLNFTQQNIVGVVLE